MSFWKDSPGPLWKDAFLSLFKKSSNPAQVYRTEIVKLPPRNSSFQIRLCKTNEMELYADFLQAHFRITEKSRCCISADRLQKGIESGWICLGAFSNETLVGTVISRSMGSCIYTNRSRGIKNGTQVFSNIDYIDFFCVHPEYQKKQIGSDLLKAIDALSTQAGRQIHCFIKEISPLWSIPPVYMSHYIVHINPSYLHHLPPPSTVNPSDLAVRGARVQTTSGNSLAFLPSKDMLDTTVYFKEIAGGKVYVAIVDLHHRSKARELYGGPIGEILWTWAESKTEILADEEITSTIESMLHLVPFEVLLADKNLPHFDGGSWQTDTPYYIYMYNFNPQQFFSLKPWFLF